MRDTFVRVLSDLALIDKNIILVTGDLGFGVLKNYWEEYPDQFINAGVAEQNMTGLAAGLALEGKTVFTYSIGNFPTLRCLEQIRNDAAYHNANVKIVAVGGGFSYGALGMSHHATEDIAIMRSLPNVTVVAPGDPWETEAAVTFIYEQKGTCYLRLGRGGERNIHSGPIHIKPGKAIELASGSDIAIFSTGGILGEAYDAVLELRKSGISCALFSFPTIKPIDRELIEQCSKTFRLLVTVEEHSVLGGFGSSVAEILAELDSPRARQIRIGIQDVYSSIVGDQPYLRNYYGISSSAIINKVNSALVSI